MYTTTTSDLVSDIFDHVRWPPDVEEFVPRRFDPTERMHTNDIFLAALRCCEVTSAPRSANFFCIFISQQLMRERQQMASRPFASVAVALDVRGEQAEMLQPLVDVSRPLAWLHTQIV